MIIIGDQKYDNNATISQSLPSEIENFLMEFTPYLDQDGTTILYGFAPYNLYSIYLGHKNIVNKSDTNALFENPVKHKAIIIGTDNEINNQYLSSLLTWIEANNLNAEYSKTANPYIIFGTNIKDDSSINTTIIGENIESSKNKGVSIFGRGIKVNENTNCIILGAHDINPSNNMPNISNEQDALFFNDTKVVQGNKLNIPNGSAGTTGQVLTKLSNAENDYAWQTPSGGGGGSSSKLVNVPMVLNYTADASFASLQNTPTQIVIDDQQTMQGLNLETDELTFDNYVGNQSMFLYSYFTTGGDMKVQLVYAEISEDLQNPGTYLFTPFMPMAPETNAQ